MLDHSMEDVSRKIHYFIRQWLNFLTNEEILNLLSVLKLEYEELPEVITEQLEFFVEEILDGIDPLIEKSLIQSEIYRALPQNMRQCLESDAFSVFTYKEKMEEAFECQIALQKIRNELKQRKYLKKSCITCELLKMIQANCNEVLFK